MQASNSIHRAIYHRLFFVQTTITNDAGFVNVDEEWDRRGFATKGREVYGGSFEKGKWEKIGLER